MPPESYLTADEVARRLRLSRRGIYKLIERGELPASRFGHAVRVHERDLAEFVSRARVPAATHS